MPVNALLTLLFLGLAAWQFWVLPLWILPLHPAWGLSLVPLALLSNTHWALLHDSLHGSLFASRRWNLGAGRGLAVLFGAPFHLLREAHLLHHARNRTAEERIEAYDEAKTSWWRTAPGYYAQLLGGLYLKELASNLLLLCPPTLLGRWQNLKPAPRTSLLDRMLRRKEILRQARFDALLVLGVFCSAAWLYRQQVWILITALCLRALLISLADYAYHYGTPLEEIVSGHNLRLCQPLSRLILNFNLHGVHHRQPGLGWRELPNAQRLNKAGYSGPFWTALGRQLRGPIPLSRLGSPRRPGAPDGNATGPLGF